MDIKCNFNPNCLYRFSDMQGVSPVFLGAHSVPRKFLRGGHYKEPVCLTLEQVIRRNKDVFIKRPAETVCAAGLLSRKPEMQTFQPQTLWEKMKAFPRNYVQNIKHTYEHKVVFALVERELFGRNSIDSITHDADKMIMYLLGFPKSFVSDFHRRHSSHHVESGKKLNLKSMLCDNIASSPEFKPEKKNSLREHFNTCIALQKVFGLKDLLEKYNYGENLDFSSINEEKDEKFRGLLGAAVGLYKLALFSRL